MSVKPSASDVKRAVEATKGVKPVADTAPSWSDVKDGFKVVPVEQGGALEANVSLDQRTEEGRKNAGLLQEMYAPHYRAEAERAANLRGSQPKATIRKGNQRIKVNEAFAETVERKHHTPRATIVVPELPWKRGS